MIIQFLNNNTINNLNNTINESNNINETVIIIIISDMREVINWRSKHNISFM